jgi:hypothetical protein
MGSSHPSCPQGHQPKLKKFTLGRHLSGVTVADSCISSSILNAIVARGYREPRN